MRARPQPPAIYAIADAEAVRPRSLAEAAEEMALAGVGWIQLRAKRLPSREIYAQVEKALRRLAGAEVTVWLDDRVDIAALLPVAGVHLGQLDLPPAAARVLLPPERWIGLSTHNRAQLVQAAADPAVDLVAIGPIFATRSKANPDPQVGLAGLRRARLLTAKPLVAIGGIDESRLAAVLDAGADAAAVIGAATGGGEIRVNCERLLRAVDQRRAEESEWR